uniref:Autophagy related 2B n=1 Tax=Astatotilapia calliptera TaxID=8154 RepID=A0AAX7T4E4_ASTCA
MPWPFSESIKKRACRYLLHRYLGNFLQEKLSLDQLSLDLYQGTGSLAQVPLDTWSLNELLETADAPFEVITGFIQTISLTVPWAALLQENCALEIKGLEMVLRPRPRVASGVEPMYWSSFMTSSMQLAKECLSQKLTDDMGESFQPFEGLEKFAETIETVLRRVKVTFLDSVFRVEHIPENSKTGIALEIRIKKIVYCDETGEESSSVNVHQPTTFAHKNVQMEGITVFWDEFSDASRAACKSSPTPSVSVETEPKLSPSWNPKIICEPHPQFTEPVSSSAPFEPVQVGSLCGKIELSLTLKNNLAMPGAKVNYLFLNHKDLRGKQFPTLFIQYQTFGVISTKFCQLFFSAGYDVFFSMADMDMLCSIKRLMLKYSQDQFPLCVHVHGCSWTLFAVCVSAHSSKTHSDESRPELVLRLTLGSLAVSVLHIDPLPPPHAAPSPLGPMAAHFFSMVGPGQLEPAAFLQSRVVFNQACPHDHLRFVGQGLKLNYDHWQGSNLRTFSTDITLNQMEFLECLFTSEAVIGGSQKGVQYTEVRPSSLSFVHLSLHNALDAFTEVFLDDSHTPANCHVSLTINAPVLGIAVRFPIPDLRSDQERGPWFKKSLQKETLYLELEELELKTEFMGGNSPDQTKMELTFKELTGMVIPGDVGEMTVFQEKTMNNSRFILELCFPNVQLTLPSKAFYEKLHNRINNDLLLWEPTAPSPVETVENMPYGVGLSVASQLINTYSKDSFSQFRSTGPEGATEQCFHLILYLLFLQKEDKTTLKNKHGEFWLEVKNAVLFSVTQYEGFKDQHYICFHTSSICMYHQGKLLPVYIKLPCRTHPHWLEPTIYQSETSSEKLSTPSEGIGLEARSMVSVAVKISSQNAERNIKEFLVAVGVRGATLQHRVVPPSLGWYDQIVDFLNVSDEPVLGYAPPTSVTTLHLHLWSCSLDYRPLYLPLRSLLVVETFSISSSVSLDNSSSTLRIILDEAALFLSDKSNAVSVNLARDYVQVVDMGTLELRITAVKPGVDGKLSEPRFELRCSSDVIHIRTCSDSCAALMNLIQYVASYGDLLPPAEPETNEVKKCFTHEESLLYEFHTTAGTPEEQIQDQEPPRSDLFLFPDESGNCQDLSPPYPMLPSPLITPAPNLAQETDDFCILETPSSRGEDRDQEPVVKQLSSEPVEVKDDHFSQPLDGSDSSRGANFPIPEVRYLIKEISVIWHLYGGKDFGSVSSIVSPARSRGSPSQTPVRQAKASGRVGGGKGRNPDVLMEIQLSKVKFQHEVYPQISAVSRPAVDQPVSRQVFSVQDLEIRDRLAASQMNKFLYLYSSKEMPRKAHSNMLTVKAMHMCPESGQAPPECCLRVTLMPLRLNIDQDALLFLRDFFTSLAAEVEFFSPPIHEGKIATKLQDPAPIISVPAQRRLSQNGFSTSGREDANDSEASASPFTDQPIFFREFRFTSEVPIRLDYHGKHVTSFQGTFAGIIFGLTQLNCSELKLRQLCYRQGLLGVDKLFSYAINEWLNDIKTNQLQGLLSGVAPIHTLVKLVHGLRDLVWLPIEQYRKDGRIVRGFQRGTASFGTSTAMAALELTNRMVRTIQAAAETAYDMVSPVPDERDTKRVKRISHYGLAHQPVDLREGVAKAYTVVKEGITDTALTIYDTATREHEQRGMTGAVGGVLRQLPPAVVKPLIMATEATSNVLGGMRNQIHPDARQEESQKWRQGDE